MLFYLSVLLVVLRVRFLWLFRNSANYLVREDSGSSFRGSSSSYTYRPEWKMQI